MDEYNYILTDKGVTLKHKIYSIAKRTDLAAWIYEEWGKKRKEKQKINNFIL